MRLAPSLKCDQAHDAKDVATRKLYPEYDDATGRSYIIKKSSDKLEPDSSEVKFAYSLKLGPQTRVKRVKNDIKDVAQEPA